MPALSTSQIQDPAARIVSRLKTDVIDVLRAQCDDLAGFGREEAYEAVMNAPELLDRSFRLLRSQPDLFAAALVDSRGKPVEPHDEVRLSCGETLGRIKALVLRTAARRYFRRYLGGPRLVAIRPRPQSVWQRLMVALGLRPPAPTRRRQQGRGDRLYKAMRDYLAFDWQAQLIPDYSALSPEMVAQLGDSLLTIREPAELRALIGDEGRLALAEHRRPLFLGKADRLLDEAGTIDAERLWDLWNQIDLGRLFEGQDPAELRKVVGEIAAASHQAIDLLMPALGRDARLFAAFLAVARKQLGEATYHDIFTSLGDGASQLQIFAARLARLPSLPPPALEEMKDRFSALLTVVADEAEPIIPEDVLLTG